MEPQIQPIENVAVRNSNKKLMMLVLLVLGTTAILNAQTTQEVAAKKDLKALDQKEILVKKEEKKDIKSYDKKVADVKQEKQKVKKELNYLKAMDINPNSKVQFTKDFTKTTNVQWKKANGFDKATFIKAGKTSSAYYDNSAKLVGTTTIKTFADLPMGAQKTINKDYKGYTTKEVIFFDDNEDNDTNMVLYNLAFEDIDSYFVQLLKGNKNIAVQVSMDGNVKYFTDMK